MVKNLPAMQENQVQSMDRDYPLEKGMATHSSILAKHILIKLTKIKHKEQILKAAREKQQITHKGPDPSSKATLWVKAQHEGALPPPCIVRKDPRVPHTARRGA